MTIRLFPPQGEAFGTDAFASQDGHVITAELGAHKVPLTVVGVVIPDGGAYADLTVEYSS